MVTSKCTHQDVFIKKMWHVQLKSSIYCTDKNFQRMGRNVGQSLNYRQIHKIQESQHHKNRYPMYWKINRIGYSIEWRIQTHEEKHP